MGRDRSGPALDGGDPDISTDPPTLGSRHVGPPGSVPPAPAGTTWALGNSVDTWVLVPASPRTQVSTSAPTQDGDGPTPPWGGVLPRGPPTVSGEACTPAGQERPTGPPLASAGPPDPSGTTSHTVGYHGTPPDELTANNALAPHGPSCSIPAANDVAAAQRAWHGSSGGDDAIDWTPEPGVAAAWSRPPGMSRPALQLAAPGSPSAETQADVWSAGVPIPSLALEHPMLAAGGEAARHVPDGPSEGRCRTASRPRPAPVPQEALDALYQSAHVDYNTPGDVFTLLERLLLRLERLGDDRGPLGPQAPPIAGPGMHALAADLRLAVQAAEHAWMEARALAP